MKLGYMKEAWIKRGTEEKIASLSYNDIRSIAVIKHGALGDLVHTRPFITELKKHFKNASITFSAISHYTRGIPRDMVDRVHITCGKEKKYTLSEKYNSAKSLGKHDIIFDISQTSRSHWVSLLNKATIKIGYKHKGIERLIYDVAINRSVFRFEAETFLEQLHVFGLMFDWPPQYSHPPSPPAIIKGNYILYFLTASVQYKTWPSEMFAKLIHQASKDFPGYKHIILSGIDDWEKKVCNDTLKNIPSNENITLIHGSDSTEILIRHASCLVSNDTGIRNLAISHNTPTVGIFIPKLISAYAPNFGQHKLAYDLNGVMPNLEDVYRGLTEILNKNNKEKYKE